MKNTILKSIIFILIFTTSALAWPKRQKAIEPNIPDKCEQHYKDVCCFTNKKACNQKCLKKCCEINKNYCLNGLCHIDCKCSTELPATKFECLIGCCANPCFGKCDLEKCTQICNFDNV
jgi:hypothetical protein